MVYFSLNFIIFVPLVTVVVAQLVRASDCDSEGRGFEPHHPPKRGITTLRNAVQKRVLTKRRNPLFL